MTKLQELNANLERVSRMLKLFPDSQEYLKQKSAAEQEIQKLGPQVSKVSHALARAKGVDAAINQHAETLLRLIRENDSKGAPTMYLHSANKGMLPYAVMKKPTARGVQ